VSRPISLVVHGHFYQPPRENPWSDELETEPSATPFHDWNARINAECYRANAYARIHDRGGRIASIENNYARMSYNFGPTLARWIERHDGRTHTRLVAADAEQERRLGAGGAMAQAYAHPILPLASAQDRRTQILWGLADFRRRFGRPAQGFWMPETAASSATLAALIELGVSFTIVAPEQVAAVRAPQGAAGAAAASAATADIAASAAIAASEWTPVTRDSVDTGRVYKWMHPDGSGRFLSVAVFDGPLSRAVAFGETTHDAAAFVAAIQAAAQRSSVASPLVLCASDGELFGHHKKFADLNLAFTTFVEGPRHGVNPTNLAAFLQEHPATWEMKLSEGPDGKGSAWSCAHGVGRWWKDCGCSMLPPEQGWNQRWRTPLRAALDALQVAAADFYEDAGSALLLDPWGARDAYGEVVDEPVPARDALLAAFGTEALAAGGDDAREEARLLLEMQRATLLMYASCGFYFDDVAGLESSLIIRLAAYAADLMQQAGGAPPLTEMLDLLATAKSNQGAGQTGADVFREATHDRITPARAIATVALARAAAPDDPLDLVPPGCSVEVVDGMVEHRGDDVHVHGSARVTFTRTGLADEVTFEAGWDPTHGFRCLADGQPVTPEDLPREDRHRLLPLLMPRLLAAADPLSAASFALAMGKGVTGTAGAAPADAAILDAYGQLLVRLLEAAQAAPVELVDLALQLLDAAGPALAAGTPARNQLEERTAALLAAVPHSAQLDRLAGRLGFAVASSERPASLVPAAEPAAGG